VLFAKRAHTVVPFFFCSFEEVPQLYIDPVECIDCGARVPVCPVSAIFALDDLPEKWKHYAELNSSYVEGGKFKKGE